MARSVLEQVSDFGDYTGGKELTEILKLTNDEPTDRLSNVRLSPDGRHIHVILREPKVGLVTFDKHERPQLAQNQPNLWPTRPTVPIVDVLYLDNNKPSGRDTAAVVYEDGKAEFWRFQDEGKAGWRLLHTSDLCNSPTARVASVCVCSGLIIWCEERPASESSPVLSSTRNQLRYCVCRRDFQVEEGAVSLGGVKIALHNNPKFTVISSGQYVHLLPDSKSKPALSVSKFFLSWSPRHDSLTLSTSCMNTPLRRLSAKESDFKRLATDCLGYLSALDPPEIHDFSPAASGGLLLLLSTGWLCLLQKDGTLRKVYKLAENCWVRCGTTTTSLCMYRDTAVALLVGQTLHLIDLNCGREIDKMVLKREGVLYVKRAEKGALHLLSETGLFVVVKKETDSSRDSRVKPSGFTAVENIHPGAFLVEAVFEEACKYYQQRSLSSTQLTVDTLKKGGRFQAPISLASILRNYLCTGPGHKGAQQPFQNGGGDRSTVSEDKLTGSLEAELKALVSLEEVKGSLVLGSIKEVEAVCESLVKKEVSRLLSSPELDREALLYLNSIFSLFPCQMWRAAQAALQLHYNGEGSLSSKAPPDVWKTVLCPAMMPSSQSSPLPFTNGRPKHNHSLKSDYNANCKTKACSSASATLPVFELLCHSVFHFQPDWLPRFLELAQQQQQQQQGSSGLGLNLSLSSSAEAGDNNNPPLYKRALRVLAGLGADPQQHQDLEVELLLVSGRPKAILQALRVLMARQQWDRVTRVAQDFCKQQSPLLHKEIFSVLLCEVAQHRDLDPYLDVLWALCPEDLTVTSILNLVLKNLPSPNTPPPSSSSSSFSMSTTPSSSPAPFADSRSSHLTIGLLKPLLRKVLQRETKPSQRYADILQSPLFPPPTPPRQPAQQPGTLTGPSLTLPLPADTPGQRSLTHTNILRGEQDATTC